ncbi:MAG: hypothetical protein ACOZJX_17255 [Pseudomonadota bacterium]
MKEAFPLLSTLSALVVFSSAALAGAGATPDRTFIDAQTTAPVTARQLQLPLGTTEIYSTFNTDLDNAYDCCGGWTVSAVGSILGFRQDVAMPFTPAADGEVRAIHAAVGWVTGTNGVAISLNADAGGMPGAAIKKGSVTGLPTFGTCCVTASIIGGAPVTAGTQYWVVVRTNKQSADTWDAWNYNNIGLAGTFAFNTGTGWQLSSSSLSAFNVVGRAP